MKLTTSFLVVGAVGLGLHPGRALGADYDLVITYGRVVDGTGAPWFRGDVGVRGDRIAAIGDLSRAKARRRIDARGQVVAPGFIDMLGQSELNVLADPRLESKVRQGITTEVTGEGSSVAPVYAKWIQDQRPWLDRVGVQVTWQDLDGYFRRLRAARPAVNIATFVGAAQVRGYVLGESDVEPSAAQLALMEHEVEKAMRQGALGVSSSLIYAPGSYAKTPELLALARAAARHGGVYATHVRGEGETILDAVNEALTIGREAPIPVEIWHLKVEFEKNWGLLGGVLDRIERARAEGIDVAADVYPYTAVAYPLPADLPAWAVDGGVEATLSRLADPAQRARIARELREGGPGVTTPLADAPARGATLLAAESPGNQRFVGKRLDEIAQALGKPAEEAILDLVATERNLGGLPVVRFLLSEDNLQRTLARPWISFNCDAPGQATDGPFAKDLSHPRAFGTMARVLGRYVRELRILRLEDAVRRMTSLPAQRVRLLDRGVLRVGMAADVVVFDPDRIRDLATFEKPLQYSEGVSHVVVNGRVVLHAGKMTGERPGKPLRPSRPTPAPRCGAAARPRMGASSSPSRTRPALQPEEGDAGPPELGGPGSGARRGRAGLAGGAGGRSTSGAPPSPTS
jgi:dihydroorotase/N-acyl-D-amino-acid deacylase